MPRLARLGTIVWSSITGMRRMGCLWLLAAILGMVLAWEVTDAPNSGPPIAATPRLQIPARQTEVSAMSREKEAADEVRTILTRPLFAPSRKPPPTVASATVPPAVVVLPRLTGVIIAPSTRLALFAPAEGKIIRAASGAVVGGYVVRTIAPDEVVLSGPEGERKLHTSFVHVRPHVIHAQQEVSAR